MQFFCKNRKKIRFDLTEPNLIGFSGHQHPVNRVLFYPGAVQLVIANLSIRGGAQIADLADRFRFSAPTVFTLSLMEYIFFSCLILEPDITTDSHIQVSIPKVFTSIAFFITQVFRSQDKSKIPSPFHYPNTSRE